MRGRPISNYADRAPTTVIHVDRQLSRMSLDVAGPLRAELHAMLPGPVESGEATLEPVPVHRRTLSIVPLPDVACLG